jgi:hypothetical protein
MALCRGTVASGLPSPDTQNDVLEVVSEFNRNLLGVSERKSREDAAHHLCNCGARHSSHQLPEFGRLTALNLLRGL